MDLHLTDDIRPVTDLRTHAAEILKQVRETRSPILITQRGRSAVVLVDAEEYQNQLETIELFAAIAEGKEDIDKGRRHSHDSVMKELDEWLK